MAAPLPWPSRAVGDPAVRRHHTSEADVGALLIPLLDLTGHCPTLRRCFSPVERLRHRIGGGDDSPKAAQTLLPPGEHFRHWGLGFKQFSLHHVGRANTTRHTVSFDSRALSQHAAVPSIFRPWVSW